MSNNKYLSLRKLFLNPTLIRLSVTGIIIVVSIIPTLFFYSMAFIMGNMVCDMKVFDCHNVRNAQNITTLFVWVIGLNYLLKIKDFGAGMLWVGNYLDYYLVESKKNKMSDISLSEFKMLFNRRKLQELSEDNRLKLFNFIIEGKNPIQMFFSIQTLKNIGRQKSFSGALTALSQSKIEFGVFDERDL